MWFTNHDKCVIAISLMLQKTFIAVIIACVMTKW